MLQASKVVIFGTSGHAKVIVDIIESDPKFELIGFIDNLIPVGKKILDYFVIGKDKSLPELINQYGFTKGVIGIGDNVRYKNKSYQVLINYIKGETDAKGYTPESNRTILIDDNDNRIVCDDYKQLIIEEAN